MSNSNLPARPARRRLGPDGPEVSALGYGAMGLSGVYGQADDAESGRLLDHLLDIGVDFIDTADVYGNGHNEELIGRVLAQPRWARAGLLGPGPFVIA